MKIFKSNIFIIFFCILTITTLSFFIYQKKESTLSQEPIQNQEVTEEAYDNFTIDGNLYYVDYVLSPLQDNVYIGTLSFDDSIYIVKTTDNQWINVPAKNVIIYPDDEIEPFVGHQLRTSMKKEDVKGIIVIPKNSRIKVIK